MKTMRSEDVEKVRIYLSQYRLLDGRINGKLDQIAQLRSLTMRCTATISDMPRGGGGKIDLADIIHKIDEIKSQMSDDIEQIGKLRSDIIKLIGTLRSPVERDVLEHIYINGWSVLKTALTMHYNPDWLSQVHRNALRHLSENATFHSV